MYLVHRFGAVALIGVVVVTLAGPASADDPPAAPARIAAELAQTQALYEDAGAAVQAAMQAYTSANAQLAGAQSNVAVADGVVIIRRAEARPAHAAAESARRGYDDANQRYLAAAGDLASARDRVSTFIGEAYKGRGMLALSSVLESRTITDLADRIGYLDQISRTETDALARYQATKATAATACTVAAAARDRAAAAETTARAALADARSAQDQAIQARAVVRALVAGRAAAVTVANQHRGAVLAEYRALRRESDRIAAELRARSHLRPARRPSSRPTAPGLSAAIPLRPGARLLIPVHGVETSGFGMRFDPYYHVWQLHAGVDLAAAGGTPIRAAAAGRIVIAGWHGGNGRYTCVDNGAYHSHEISTCYAHQSRMLVHPGQRVRRGEVIGLVGETGAATGYHLHFEVRVDGDPVQPLNWLPSCLC